MSNDPRIRGWEPGRPLHLKSKDACKWCEGSGYITIDEDDENPLEIECAKCNGKGFNGSG